MVTLACILLVIILTETLGFGADACGPHFLIIALEWTQAHSSTDPAEGNLTKIDIGA